MFSNMARVYRYLGVRGVIVAVYFLILKSVVRLFGKRTLVRSVHNYKLRLDTFDKGLSRTLFMYGKREVDHYKMLHAVLQPGMTILDIGANIGYYVIMEAIAIGPTGTVIAIEPMLSNIKMLEKNIELNGVTNVKVGYSAVSASTGISQMFESKRSNLHTFHRDGSAFDYLEAEPVDVPTITLAEIVEIADHKTDLIRMDVEGHEVEILGQLADLVKNDIISPKVIFETHLTRYTLENDFAPVLENLFSLGYAVRTAASSGKAGTVRLKALGYQGGEPFYSDFGERTLFDNIGNEHAIDLICRTGGLRTVLLEKTG